MEPKYSVLKLVDESDRFMQSTIAYNEPTNGAVLERDSAGERTVYLSGISLAKAREITKALNERNAARS